MPDPKLQAAALQIQAILRAHDIGGVVVIASPSHTQYLLELTPTWSCAKWEGAEFLRVRALRKDFASQEEQKKVVTATAGMFLGFHTTLIRVREQIKNLLLTLGKQVEISHWDIDEKIPPPTAPPG